MMSGVVVGVALFAVLLMFLMVFIALKDIAESLHAIASVLRDLRDGRKGAR